MTTPILFLLPSSSTFSSVLLHLLPRHYPPSVNVFSATASASINNHRIPTTCTITAFCSIVLSSARGCLQAKKISELIADSTEPRFGSHEKFISFSRQHFVFCFRNMAMPVPLGVRQYPCRRRSWTCLCLALKK